MNTLKNNEIMEALQKHYDYFINEYSNERILGVFGYGMVNYGFAERDSDISLSVIYIPSFEDVCLNTSSFSQTLCIDRHLIVFKDFRDAYDVENIQSACMVEALYTDYYIINPIYEELFFKLFRDQRESIMEYNRTRRVKNQIERAKNNIDLFFNSYTQIYDVLFEALRLGIAAELFSQLVSTKDCITLRRDYHIKYLYDIRHGVNLPTKEEATKMLDEILDNLLDYPVCEYSRAIVKDGILAILKFSFVGIAEHTNFLDSLTETEKLAFDALKEKLDNGAISISINKMIEQTKISRPVFKNLLQKMEQYNVAEITNQGVKGTAIKLLI